MILVTTILAALVVLVSIDSAEVERPDPLPPVQTAIPTAQVVTLKPQTYLTLTGSAAAGAAVQKPA
jgi:hypothetical protein